VGIANGGFEYDNDDLMKEYGYGYSKTGNGIGTNTGLISPLPPLDDPGKTASLPGTMKKGSVGFTLFPPASEKGNVDPGDKF
jgi:hypothetical protein